MSIKVTLRKKAISGGRQSLYLDFYPAIVNPETGNETRRQFLNQFIFDSPKLPLDKAHNKETLHRAELIRQKRENELNRPEVYSGFELDQIRRTNLAEKSFTEYFKELARKRSGSTWNAWESVRIHLENYHKGDIKFKELTETLCNDFREYLQTKARGSKGGKPLAPNTAAVYFSKFKTALRQGYKAGYLQTDLSNKVEGLGQEETHRTTLTLEEVKALINAECSHPIIKQAAIFSVYTGLRFSDIQKLTWGEIQESNPGEWAIHFRQKKTKNVEVLPISSEALQLLGERRGDATKVFEGLKYLSYYNKALSKWTGLASLTKNVTFHCFRHTFATLQLTLGTDFYTVQKMLGHRDPKTTQIYAKIVDETKRKAANRISLINQ